jgi:hypothetical protein
MTARTGLSYIITELRGMTDAGTADYTVAGAAYWTDDQLQVILDNHRHDLTLVELQAREQYSSGGTLQYFDYYAPYGYFEQTTGGSAIFYVQDGSYAIMGTTTYTPDYRRGVVSFAADTSGSTYYLTGRSYDIYGAAADIWRRKASHYTTSVNFSTDNHSVSMGAVIENCLKMAQYYQAQAGTTSGGAMGATTIERPDTDWQ